MSMLVVVFAGVTLLPRPASARAAPLPAVITAMSVTPTALPATGGEVTVRARVKHAASCRFNGPAASAAFACVAGLYSISYEVPANTTASTATYSVTLTARNRRGPSTVTVSFTEAASPPITGLDACSPSQNCDYGPAFATYQSYGNTAPNILGDCTFAAAANWEQIVLNITPDPTVLGFEFAQAGGTVNGLAQNALWTYWEHQGIGGEILTGLHKYYSDQNDVEQAVRDYGALIVELRFVANDGFAQYTVPAGNHDAVVDGFTPEGPLVVTWGQTLQMTWQQWNDEVVGMWGIGTSTAG